MKKPLMFQTLVGLAGLVSVTAPITRVSAEPESPVERGRYLVTVMGCGDCHSPHGQDGKPIPGREFSGHPEGMPLPVWKPEMMKDNVVATINPTLTAFAGPFGVSVAGNLTPDPETGIGKKTADQLVESWKTGKHWKEDRMVLPPMPMAPYKELKEEDVRAIFAYLMTLKPIKNACPKSVPAAP